MAGLSDPPLLLLARLRFWRRSGLAWGDPLQHAVKRLGRFVGAEFSRHFLELGGLLRSSHFLRHVRSLCGAQTHINRGPLPYGLEAIITRKVSTGRVGFALPCNHNPDCNSAAERTLYGVLRPPSSVARLSIAPISAVDISLACTKILLGRVLASFSISELFSGTKSFATFHLACLSTALSTIAREYASWSSLAYTISTEARGPSPKILKKPGPSIERGPTCLRSSAKWVSASAVFFFCAFSSTSSASILSPWLRAIASSNENRQMLQKDSAMMPHITSRVAMRWRDDDCSGDSQMMPQPTTAVAANSPISSSHCTSDTSQSGNDATKEATNQITNVLSVLPVLGAFFALVCATWALIRTILAERHRP